MKIASLSLCLFLLCATAAFSQSAPSNQPALPYSPSLDLDSMDRSVDPCVDLYQYSCGGWQKKNPIPPDQTSWSVYGKLYVDNLNFLRTILEQAASGNQRNAVTQKIGDFYGACMDESAAEKRGLSGLQPTLDEIARLNSVAQLTPLISRLQLTFNKILFDGGSEQDPDDSDKVIAGLDQGGLGLPDRDYYVKDDAKSKETRERYVQHVQTVFELTGDTPEIAKSNAETVMRLETELAKASQTRVARRNPYNLKHKMTLVGSQPTGASIRLEGLLSRRQLSRVRNHQRELARFLQGSERLADLRTDRQLENLSAFPRRRFRVAVLVVEIC